MAIQQVGNLILGGLNNMFVPAQLCLHFSKLYSMFCLLFTMKGIVESALHADYVPGTLIVLEIQFWTNSVSPISLGS